MNENQAEPVFVTADELLAAASKALPYVDVDLGGGLMRMRLAPSYDEMLELNQRRQKLVADIRGPDCPKELRPYRGLSDEAIGAAGLIAFQALNPTLSLEQALKLTQDGVTIKVIQNAIQKAAVMHLMTVAEERIEAGKAASSRTPPTD
jgi:hypothetical protein